MADFLQEHQVVRISLVFSVIHKNFSIVSKINAGDSWTFHWQVADNAFHWKYWKLEIKIWECKYCKDFKEITILFNSNCKGITKDINKIGHSDDSENYQLLLELQDAEILLNLWLAKQSRNI